MDFVLFVELLVKVLIGVCLVLTAFAVVFLAIRPLLDPHWRERRDEVNEETSAGPREQWRESAEDVRKGGALGV